MFRKLFALILLLHLTLVLLFGQEENYIIDYISVDDGLSQNEVTSICKDAYGFMWFGTRGGLNRYDGYEFKHFKPTRQTTTSIENPSVENIFVDKSGKIWIGLKTGGFNMYDPKQERFFYSEELEIPSPSRVISIFEDKDGEMWFGSFNNGVLNYNPVNNTSNNYYPSSRVCKVIQTADSTLWFGATNQLIFKKKDEGFIQFSLKNSYYEITDMVVDNSDPYLWLVGWELELIRFNYRDFTFKSFELPRKNNTQINTYSLLQDNHDNIWVGTWGKGLFHFNKKSEKFNKVNINPGSGDNKTANYNIILDIFQDEEKTIWIGTDGGGIVTLSPSNNFYSIASQASGNNFSVASINTTSSDELIIGTRGGGMYRSKDRKKFTPIYGQSLNDASLNQMNIYSVFRDGNDEIWAGFDNGLYVLPENNNSITELVSAAEYFQNPDLRLPRKVHDILHRGDEYWFAGSAKWLVFI